MGFLRGLFSRWIDGVRCELARTMCYLPALAILLPACVRSHAECRERCRETSICEY